MDSSTGKREESTSSAVTDLASRCSYAHDVSAFDDIDGDEWQCRRHVYDDRNRCRFHLPPAERDDVDAERFLDAVTTADGDRHEQRERKRFIGARFGDLDLRHVVVDAPNNYPVDLRDASFEGTVDLTKAVVEQPLWFDRARIAGAIRFRRTRFAEHVSLRDVRVEGAVDAARSTFDRNLDVDRAVFAGDVSFYGVTFEQYVGFVGAEIDGEFDFHQVDVGDNAHLHDMVVRGPTNFSKIDAPHRFWCFDNVFEGDVEMEKAVVGGPAFFDYTEFGGDVNYWNTTFEGRVRWKENVFHGEVAGDDLSTESTAKFLRPTFRDDVDLRRLDADAGLWITEPKGAAEISLRRASVSKGRLGRSPESETVYDLTEARVGDVRLEPDPEAGFAGYRFDRTRFDGFDFAAYHEALDGTGWGLEPDDADRSGFEPAAAEETYLKAKNGATLVGDSTAAAEFFRKEMTHRRRRHAARARDADLPRWTRLKATGRWIASGLLDLTTGYGERPWRVVACSVGVIGLFTLFYATTVSATPYDSPVGYVLFSVESFVALVLGGAANIESLPIRLVAQVEGFLGAFFIALFVFTLTRSVQR